MTDRNKDDLRALLDAMEYIGHGDIYIEEHYTIALKRLIEEHRKLQRQTKISANEFEKCLKRKEMMIGLFVKEKANTSKALLNDMTEQDIYREYEQKAIIALENNEDEFEALLGRVFNGKGEKK